MVGRVNQYMDNIQHRLLTIQHPCNHKQKEKKDLEDKENGIEKYMVPHLIKRDISHGGWTMPHTYQNNGEWCGVPCAIYIRPQIRNRIATYYCSFGTVVHVKTSIIKYRAEGTYVETDSHGWKEST